MYFYPANENKMNKRMKFWGLAGLMIVTSVLLIISISGTKTIFLKDGISESDWVEGNPQAKIILIEYSDFECPACKIFAEEIQKIVDEFGNHIAFVYRHYPLESIHEYAMSAAYASEAAGAQGKFWEMHDMLFLTQEDWTTQQNPEESFFNYAKSMGLDMKKFEEDYNSRSIRNRVKESKTFAEKIGLTGTPTLFINGQQINNPRSHEDFRKLIRDAIAKNS